MSKLVYFLLGMGFVASLQGIAAQPGIGENAPAPGDPSDLFTRGRFEASVNNGLLFSPFIASSGRPTIDYTLSSVQLGYMLGGVNSAGWFSGNFEAAAEAFASAVFEGPGGYISGSTLWMRYNFVPPRSHFIPYLQAGAGLTTTDIDHHIVGEPFNFNLDLAFGMRCFVAQHWSINLEYRYQHVSNANIGHHNLGINSHGPVLGVSFLF